jgi:hypothetical protein
MGVQLNALFSLPPFAEASAEALSLNKPRGSWGRNCPESFPNVEKFGSCVGS